MKKKIMYIILIVFFSMLLIYSGIHIIEWFRSNKRNADIKKEISEYIKIEENKKEEVEIENNEVKYQIDFKALKEINNDVVAYLRVNNTNVDYVIVKGKDNSYYLKHNLNKEYNISGWPFVDYNNKFDGTDRHVVIYGHNTNDGSMFGTLKNILSKEWYNNEDNLNVILVTEDATYTYKVFSVYKIKKEDYYINTFLNNDNEYKKFLNTIKNRSIKDFNVEVDTSDKILTLSTCAEAGANRVVLHAKLDVNE